MPLNWKESTEGMPYFTHNGAKIYYREHGEGEPVVLTHGASWDHRQWQPQVEALSRTHRVICWDIRGHGRSTLPDGTLHPDHFYEDLLELLRHLRIQRAHLCGLSLGGLLSLQTAIQHPEMVRSLTLIGTICTFRFNWYEKLSIPISRISTRLIPMNVLAFMEAKVLATYNAQNEPYLRQVVQQIPHRNWVRLWDAITRIDVRQGLNAIDCPVLLLEGEHDSFVRRQQAFMLGQIKQAKNAIIPQAHHATNLDNPHAVNDHIVPFLQQNGIEQTDQ